MTTDTTVPKNGIFPCRSIFQLAQLPHHLFQHTRPEVQDHTSNDDSTAQHGHEVGLPAPPHGAHEDQDDGCAAGGDVFHEGVGVFVHRVDGHAHEGVAEDDQDGEIVVALQEAGCVDIGNGEIGKIQAVKNGAKQVEIDVFHGQGSVFMALDRVLIPHIGHARIDKREQQQRVDARLQERLVVARVVLSDDQADGLQYDDEPAARGEAEAARQVHEWGGDERAGRLDEGDGAGVCMGEEMEG